MAIVDVTDLLNDIDFVDQMSLITRVPTVNAMGENVLVETTLDSYGSIQAASGRVIDRLPDLLRVANLSSFWFKGTIVASSTGKYPSILVFKGQRYQVKHVFDWTNYGAGWCEGACVMEVPAP